jgi:hypothetical protein
VEQLAGDQASFDGLAETQVDALAGPMLGPTPGSLTNLVLGVPSNKTAV